jgi:hypothetical protein
VTPRADYAGVRYRQGSPHGHVESYFLKANDLEGRRAIWIKATVYASDRDPSRAVAEAWAVAFDRARGHVAVKTGVPFEAARFSQDELDVEVAGAVFTRHLWKGSVTTGDRAVAWDLRVSRAAPPLVHFPLASMYEGPFPASKIVALVPDARAHGEVRVSGETWDVAGWPMTIGHNWGRGHAARYAWAHCNVWRASDPSRPGEPPSSPPDGVVFEGFAARIALGPVLSPASTFVFVRPGASAPWVSRRSLMGVGGLEQETSLRRWKFHTTFGKARIDGEVWAETDDFVGLYYPNPNGQMTYCLNSKLARAEIVVRTPGRGRRIYTSNAAALEIATTDPGHGIRMHV